MSLLHDEKGLADQKLQRLKSLLSEKDVKYVESITDNTAVCPVYDILAINTVINQETI